MQEVASNTIAIINIDHVYNGETLTLTNMQYQLLDATGNVLIATTNVPSFNGALESQSLSIAANYNNITAKKEIRQLNIFMVTASGTYQKSIFYIVKSNVLNLTVLTDSFQTFAESLSTRLDITDMLDSFDELTDEQKAVALENSYNRLVKLKFVVGGTVIEDLSALTLSAFNALNPKFLKALKQAQIVESNSLVEFNPVKDKIRSGIVSETIGESSMFFRQGSVPETIFKGISDDAYEYLGDYIFKGNTGTNSTSNSQIWKIYRA